jgi:hypothetical protein
MGGRKDLGALFGNNAPKSLNCPLPWELPKNEPKMGDIKNNEDVIPKSIQQTFNDA